MKKYKDYLIQKKAEGTIAAKYMSVRFQNVT